jgi:hypothetical protein
MAGRMWKEQRKAAFLAAASETFEALEGWCDAHPEATFGEIEEEARKKRRELMGKALEILVNGRDTGYQEEGVRCMACGRWMEYKGERFGRTVYSLEGDVRLERAYYVCPDCEGETVFPPGPETGVAGGSLE